MTNSLIVAALILIFVSVAGCAIIGSGPERGQLAMQYATAKAINGDPERAERVIDWIKSIEGANRPVSLDGIETALRARVRWDRLSPEDAELINYLIRNTREALQDQFGAGVLDPSDMIELKRVLGWIHETANRTYTARL